MTQSPPDRSDFRGCCQNWITITNDDPLFSFGEILYVEVVNGYLHQTSQCSVQVTYGENAPRKATARACSSTSGSPSECRGRHRRRKRTGARCVPGVRHRHPPVYLLPVLPRPSTRLHGLLHVLLLLLATTQSKHGRSCTGGIYSSHSGRGTSPAAAATCKHGALVRRRAPARDVTTPSRRSLADGGGDPHRPARVGCGAGHRWGRGWQRHAGRRPRHRPVRLRRSAVQCSAAALVAPVLESPVVLISPQSPPTGHGGH